MISYMYSLPHQTRLRESERRCALESLHYEELLLELESSRMRQKYESIETAAGVIPPVTTTFTFPFNDVDYGITQNGPAATDTTAFRSSYSGRLSGCLIYLPKYYRN